MTYEIDEARDLFIHRIDPANNGTKAERRAALIALAEDAATALKEAGRNVHFEKNEYDDPVWSSRLPGGLVTWRVVDDCMRISTPTHNDLKDPPLPITYDPHAKIYVGSEIDPAIPAVIGKAKPRRNAVVVVAERIIALGK